MQEDQSINKKIFLKEANLEGYKSILNSGTYFNPNLNIIIGQNGSGKSNFIEFIYKSLLLDYRDIFNFGSYIELDNSDNKQFILSVTKKNIESSDKDSNDNTVSFTTPLNYKITVKKNNTVISEYSSDLEDKNHIERDFELHEFDFSVIIIRHGIPDNYFLVDKPLSFKSRDFSIILGNNIIRSYFVKSLISPFVLGRSHESKSPEDFKKALSNDVESNLEKIKNVLKNLTPIKNIRLNKDFTVFLEKNTLDKPIFLVNNMFLEFKINNLWLPFSSLSDGTKRLFYIVSEILAPTNILIKHNLVRFRIKQFFNKIILLEEPELGIHPNALKILMDFLNEESKENQIIMTTHSPQALDVLSGEELDQIIISNLSSKNGSQFNHLTNNQSKKAKAFMENQFLSDYWRFSDLNR